MHGASRKPKRVGTKETRMKNLILLQENSGQADFLSSIPDAALRNLVKTGIDGLAENFESIKTSLQMFGYYDKVINLTDAKCTKANLLAEMIKQSKEKNIFDLLILGHGSDKTLYLHDETLTDTGIAQLLADARQLHPNLKFTIRLVYMCNCFSASLLDSWLNIGAKTALGCKNVNYMPEPQTTFFFDDFVKKGLSVIAANNQSFDVSNAIWSVVGLSASNRSGSKLTVKGENIRFDGRRLAVGEVVTRNIHAGNTHNFTNVYMIKGEKYKLTASSSDNWKNGSRSTNANGYAQEFFDNPRQPYNMMALTGEMFNNNGNVLSYNGSHFKIGTSKNLTVSKSGYLVCHANDGIVFYGDNSGKIALSIKRNA